MLSFGLDPVIYSGQSGHPFIFKVSLGAMGVAMHDGSGVFSFHLAVVPLSSHWHQIQEALRNLTLQENRVLWRSKPMVTFDGSLHILFAACFHSLECE